MRQNGHRRHGSRLLRVCSLRFSAPLFLVVAQVLRTSQPPRARVSVRSCRFVRLHRPRFLQDSLSPSGRNPRRRRSLRSRICLGFRCSCAEGPFIWHSGFPAGGAKATHKRWVCRPRRSQSKDCDPGLRRTSWKRCYCTTGRWSNGPDEATCM